MVRARVETGIELHNANARRGLRKDANVLADWVVTLPADCRAEDASAFFRAVVEFVRERYGAENVPGGFVHADEATPHVHVPVVPVHDGRLVASKVFDRADLQGWHEALSARVEAALGYRVSVLLSEEKQAEKQLSAMSQDEYRAAKEKESQIKDAQAASFRDAQAQAVTGPRQRTEKRIQLMVSVRPPPGDAQAEIDFAAGHQSIHDATFPAQAGYSTSMVIWSLV